MKSAALLAASLMVGAEALSQIHEERKLMQYTVVFDECVGKSLADCQDLICKDVEANPEIFENRSCDDFVLHEGHVREVDQSNYHMIGLRTNIHETGVGGVLGDGMIFYPFPWCLSPDNPRCHTVANPPDDCCYSIGPWDCDMGTPLSVEECCNLIKAAEPHPDIHGNYLSCFESYPVGSIHNPVDYSRIMIHVDNNGNVVHPPRNE